MSAPVRVLSQIKGANFPVDEEGRVYHLGVKRGEVCNRIITVGDLARAKMISTHFDEATPVFECLSSRGFAIYTGRYKGVPVSVIGIGMGFPMMDFMVRECRAIIDGKMAIVRFGTCGAVNPTVPVGTLAVASKGSIFVQRNPLAFSSSSSSSSSESASESPYIIYPPVLSDAELSKCLFEAVEQRVGAGSAAHCLNGSADSFYSSQGRTGPFFDDRNETLVDDMVSRFPELVSLEMETYHLFDLARCSRGSVVASGLALVLAQRRTEEFIELGKKKHLEREAGICALDAIIAFKIDESDLMTSPECVWKQSKQ